MGEQSLSQPHPQPLSPSPPASAASTPALSASTTLAAASASASRPKKKQRSSDSSASKKPRLALSVRGRPLSADGEVAAAIRYLRAADPSLAAVIDAHEPPAFHCPHRPFHSLVRSILYQQLAFKAAASVYSRFVALLGGEPGVLPDAVLALTADQLRHIGVSPRKASYLHDLARKYATGILSDASIVAMDDRSLASMLTMVSGIGTWSVHMFMIFSLARPDVLPSADLGVRKGVQMLYGLHDVPRPSQMDKLCQQWRPYRSVAAWYMWRLMEAKNTTMPPLITPALPAPGQPFTLQQQQQHQPAPIQIIDPGHMLPGLG